MFSSQRLSSSLCYPEHLTLKELKYAKFQLFRMSQEYTYPNEMSMLKNSKSLPFSSTLCKYNPYLDNVKVLRIGGRLGNANLPMEMAHPMILSSRSHLVRLYLEEVHKINVHASRNVIFSLVANKMYIAGMKTVIKSICNKCVPCRKAQARCSSQQMGNLPAERVTPARPFSIIGVDLAGPIHFKEGRSRKPCHMKGYVCVYICLVTRAVFFDLLEDLSTVVFLSSLRRFTALYGKPDRVLSDNGSNFIGASGEMPRVINFLKAQSTMEELNQWCSTHDVSWTFIPSRAPNFGGMWEAAVRSMKLTLRKVVGTHVLRREELQTLLLEAASMLNSRPLATIDSVDGGVKLLTPAHFLVGSMPKVLPLDPDPDSKTSFGRKWALMEKLYQDLWSKWRTEYLQNLQKRVKWKKESNNLRIGDVVLMTDSDMGVKAWPMGQITKVYPGSDGLVRAADVYANAKTYTRPIRKLVLLVPEDSRLCPPAQYVEAVPSARN